jgi:hypothetical protein
MPDLVDATLIPGVELPWRWKLVHYRGIGQRLPDGTVSMFRVCITVFVDSCSLKVALVWPAGSRSLNISELSKRHATGRSHWLRRGSPVRRMPCWHQTRSEYKGSMSRDTGAATDQETGGSVCVVCVMNVQARCATHHAHTAPRCRSCKRP